MAAVGPADDAGGEVPGWTAALLTFLQFFIAAQALDSHQMARLGVVRRVTRGWR